MKHRLFRIGQQVMLALALGLGLTLALLWAVRGELTPSAYAATFNVDIFNDSFDGTCTSASCSLRDAIIVANNNVDVDDTIYVPAGVYTLSIAGVGEDNGLTGDLDIYGGNLTIIGQGATPADTIINASYLDRVFDVQPVGVTTVTLENLTITGGLVDQGGGVRVRAVSLGTPHLILNDVIITQNTITGANQIPYPDAGGGLLNVQADVTLNNCQVTSNTAIVAGGGLGNLGVMVLAGASVSANQSLSGSGGGIGNAGVLYLNNSSVSGNKAFDSYGLNTVGVGDGGGIGNQSTGPGSGVVTLVSSPVSNNQADVAGGGIASSSGSLTLSNSPISGNSSAMGGGIVQSTGSGQLILSDSPVSSNTLKPSTSTRAGIGNGGGIANGGIITATNSPIFNNTAVATTTAQAGGIINDGVAWLINSPVFSNAANVLGGGIGNTPNGNLTLNNSPVLSNALYGSFSDGGGIFNNGRLDLTDSPVSGNQAWYGGGLENYSLVVTPAVASLTRSDVTYNQAAGHGGGIYNGGNSIVTLTTLTVADNQAGRKGGGINNNIGYLILSGVVISHNRAITTGGGIWQAEGFLDMMNSAVVNNNTDGNGGGLSIGYTSTVTITNSTFSGNWAFTNDSTDSSGGGLYEEDVWPKIITLNNVTIANNESDWGGGLYQGGSGVINMANTIVASNTAYTIASDIFATVHSDGYNLIGDTTNATLTGDLTGNITNQGANLDTLTGSLPYHPLLAGSPAIDAGNPAAPGGDFPACAATDQLGATRPQSTACDIGAFESLLSGVKKVYLPIILSDME